MDDQTFEAGEITELAVQKNDRNRVSVFIDDTFAFGVHKDLVLEHQLHTGRALSADEQRALVEADRLVKAKQRAMNYLAHKPRTETEVRRKLQRDDLPPGVIDQVIERLYELSYLDDQEYAYEYVRRRFASKGYGPVRIRSELQERGVERHLVEAALDAELVAEDVTTAARAVAQKRWARLDDDEDPRKRRNKLYGYLKRRGYTYDTIRTVIDDVTDESVV